MKEGWTYKKLGEICEKGTSNISLNKIEDNEGNYPLYGASGYVKSIDFFHQSKPYIGVVKDGNGVGRVGLYPAMTSLVGTMQYIYPKGGNEIGYLKYLLIGLHLEKFKTGAAIPHIYYKDYSKSLVPVPSLREQQHIVSELDLLSEAIEKQKAQIDELNKLAQSIFYDMFGYKDWTKKTIKEIANVKIGPFGSALHQHDYISGGTPLVNPIHMQNSRIVIDNNFTISQEKKAELSNYLLKADDVIFGRRGDIGRCALVTEKEDGYLCGTGSLFVRFNIDINPIYSINVLNSNEVRQYLLDNARGATMLNLNSKIIEGISIPLPPLPLQQEFAAKIEAIEDMKAKVHQSLKESEQLFNSRMDYYFN